MSDSSLRLPAPAKINLCLKISGRAKDGYHNLHTIFHFLNCSDSLIFETTHENKIRFSCSNRSLNNKSNLVYKAAKLLQQNFEPDLGCNIHLEKLLPMEGGIGAGSSDAATTLLALNRLWKLGLNLDQLAHLGVSLGADVPVFIRGQTALGEGRGECLQAINVPEFYYLLVKPKASVSTAAVFAHQELTRDSSPRTIRAFLNGGSEKSQSFQRLLQFIEPGNDCELLVRKLYPVINECLELLSQFGMARLTGTGACVFVPFETQDSARQVMFAVRGSPLIEQVFLAKGLNHSPVHALLEYSLC